MKRSYRKNYLYQMEPGFDANDVQSVADCVRSTWLLEGPRTAAFEHAIAEYVGARFAVAVPSCTVALAVSLMALGIGPGDEVIVPDLTFVATANAVNLAGAAPVFVDIQQSTLGLDPFLLQQAVSGHTRAIIPVWLNGRDPGMQAILGLARKCGLAVVEDAACGLGSRTLSKHAGTFGDLGCFSFNTTKIITTGTGGMIVTDDSLLYERVKRLKNHGRLDRHDYHPMIGFNFGFSDLLASLGLTQMGKLSERVAWKRRICEKYYERLSNISGIEIPPLSAETNLWYPTIFVEDPPALKEFLELRGVQTRLYYPPIHTQPCYLRHGDFPVAESVARHGLWLPIAFTLSETDVERVCQNIQEYFE